MKDFQREENEVSYIVVKNEIVKQVSSSFSQLSEFSLEELLSKNISTIWNELLHVSNNYKFTGPFTEAIFFTKSFEVRFAIIERKLRSREDEFIYIFRKKENLHFEDKLLFVNRLISDNKLGIGIFTVPGLILIKASDTYLKYLPAPYNTKEVVYGKKMKDFMPNFQGSNGEKTWESIIKSNESIYITEKQGLMLGRDYDYWDNIIIPIVEGNEVRYIVSMLQNVTKRVLSREHIQLKNKQLEIILENAKDTIHIVDIEDGRVVIDKFLRGSTKGGEIENFLVYGKFYKEDGTEIKSKGFITEKVMKGEAIDNLRLIAELDNKKIYLNIKAKPIFDEDEKVIQGIIITEDITDLIDKENKIRTQQEMLILKEKEKREVLERSLAMKDEFISSISHEFKTPLNVIYAAVQSMEQIYYNQLPERVKSLVGNIKQNTFRQLRLVNNLLDITRINSNKAKLNIRNIDIVLLTKVIIESVKVYADQRNINLQFRSKIKSKIISIDDEKYERIMLNLLSNALKFTNKDGKIIVSISSIDNSKKICIKVIDTGIGIPEDKQEFIFERFGQVESDLSKQAEGTGIGLSLVKSLVEILGGTISLESKLGSGSTFSIMLPAEKLEIEEALDVCLDSDSRLIREINVEFSDIYSL